MADAAVESKPPTGTASSSEPPVAASETVYINNLNEKVKPEILKASLKSLFSTYGKVLSVTAHSNYRMRGQAFVAFADKELAAKAVKEVAGFPLYGKPMQLTFAKTRSDAVVKASCPGGEEDDLFKEHKKARLIHKRQQRRGNVHRRRELEAKIRAKKGAVEGATTSDGAPAAAPSTSKRTEIAMPDEYLPPNAILFLQNLPPSIGKEELERLFAKHAGLVDVRIISERNVAFVEFGDVAESVAAREGLNGHVFEGGEKLKITFARA